MNLYNIYNYYKTTLNILYITVLLFLLSFFQPAEIYGQSISFSVSPPIYEAVMAPNETASYEYQIVNNGPRKQFKLDIVPASVSNEYGESQITEKPNAADRDLINSIFGITSPNKAELGSIITIDRGETANIGILIRPPQNIQSGDYYFTFIVEALAEANTGFGSGAGAVVGSNIILSIVHSKEFEKQAKITYFQAPLITDSLTDISYKVMIENTGDYYFKPQGEIAVENILGSFDILDVAPLNILSGTKRIIPCISEEMLVECRLNKKFLIGVYKAELKFTADAGGKTYSSQKTTIAFPFSILLVLMGIVSFVFVLKRRYFKHKSSIAS